MRILPRLAAVAVIAMMSSSAFSMDRDDTIHKQLEEFKRKFAKELHDIKHDLRHNQAEAKDVVKATKVFMCTSVEVQDPNTVLGLANVTLHEVLSTSERHEFQKLQNEAYEKKLVSKSDCKSKTGNQTDHRSIDLQAGAAELASGPQEVQYKRLERVYSLSLRDIDKSIRQRAATPTQAAYIMRVRDCALKATSASSAASERLNELLGRMIAAGNRATLDSLAQSANASRLATTCSSSFLNQIPPGASPTYSGLPAGTRPGTGAGIANAVVPSGPTSPSISSPAPYSSSDFGS